MGTYKNLIVILILKLTLFSQETSSAKILAISFISTKSHFITYEPLLLALADRGHEITIANSVQTTKPAKNIRRIFTYDNEKRNGNMTNYIFLAKANEPNTSKFWEYLRNPYLDYVDYFVTACTESYKIPEVQALKNETFDLIIFPAMGNECLYGLIHHLKAPTILFSQMTIAPFNVASFGNPMLPAVVPMVYYGFGERMNFWERTGNLFGVLYYEVTRMFYYLPKMEDIYGKYVRPGLPGVSETERNFSMALVNSHFNFVPPRPLTPDVVEVGGMHLRGAKTLPQDFKDFCDGAKDGVIIFTMGSILPLSQMPEKYRDAFLNVFGKLKQRVIWKWETEPLPNLPKNILQSKWLPQQDILGHNNTRLFITHGGYGSTSEALYAGVPLLGIPMMAEQQWNVDQAVAKGFALQLKFSDISEETLLATIQKLVNDKTYFEKAKFLSKLYHDHMEGPLERAIYWVEYVIRYNGAPHLRSVGREMNMFQYYSLDSIAFIGVLVLTILISTFLVLGLVIRKLMSLFGKTSKKAIKGPKKTQ